MDAMETGNFSATAPSQRPCPASATTWTSRCRFQSMDFGFPFVPFINNGQVPESATARVDYLPDPTIGDCT